MRLFVFALLLTGSVLHAESLALAEAGERRTTVQEGVGILEIAKKYLGVPYRFGGSTPDGFDCSGFTGYVYAQIGQKLPRDAGDQFSAGRPVKVPRVGDLVFFKIDGKKISHVGIYAGDLRFIHAPSTGKTVSFADMRIDYWKKRYAGARTLFAE